jgi:hypothetical protein
MDVSESLVGIGLNIRDFPLPSARLSSHSCNYGIFSGWCPYSPWATCIDKCRVGHGEATVFVNIQDDVDKDNAAGIPLQLYRVEYLRHSRACSNVDLYVVL